MCFYLGFCVFCGRQAIGLAELYAAANGEPMVLKRPICREDWLALLELELPMPVGSDGALLAAVLQEPLIPDPRGVLHDCDGTCQTEV
jgi:hypothetical protein